MTTLYIQRTGTVFDTESPKTMHTQYLLNMTSVVRLNTCKLVPGHYAESKTYNEYSGVNLRTICIYPLLNDQQAR